MHSLSPGTVSDRLKCTLVLSPEVSFLFKFVDTSFSFPENLGVMVGLNLIVVCFKLYLKVSPDKGKWVFDSLAVAKHQI